MYNRTRSYWPEQVAVLLALVICGVAAAVPLDHTPYPKTGVNGQAPSSRSTPAVGSRQTGTAASTASLSVTPATAVYGQEIALGALVSAVPPATGTPTGYIQLYFSGIPTLLYQLNSDGSYVYVYTPGDPTYRTGTTDVEYAYRGDATFNFDLSNTITLTINPASVTVTVAATPEPSLVNQSYTVSWTVQAVAPGAGTPTGTVTVSDGTTSCSAAVSVGSCALTGTTAGQPTLTASYSGDANFLSGSGATQHTVSTVGAVPRVPHRIAMPMIVNAR